MVGSGRGSALAAAAIAGLVLAAPAGAQEQVAVAAGVHDGYGRIAFEWPESVAFEARLDGRTVTTHFARPLTADLKQIPRRLAPYVESAVMDGPSDVVIKLTRDVALKSFATDDKKVVLDLFDRTAAATPAATASPAPPE